MSYFVYKLVAPRPTFAQTMTDAEAALMQRHGAYWIDLVGRGIVIVFGPVADPKGTWGLAVIEADNESHAHTYGENDPATKADVGFQFEVYRMPQATLRKSV